MHAVFHCDATSQAIPAIPHRICFERTGDCGRVEPYLGNCVMYFYSSALERAVYHEHNHRAFYRVVQTTE